jgi:hypothetical protein
MPRPATTPAQRFAAVEAAYAQLGALIDAQRSAIRKHGAESVAARSAAEAVEVHGATIHRQSRLLAGKSKGG